MTTEILFTFSAKEGRRKPLKEKKNLFNSFYPIIILLVFCFSNYLLPFPLFKNVSSEKEEEIGKRKGYFQKIKKSFVVYLIVVIWEVSKYRGVNKEIKRNL